MQGALLDGLRRMKIFYAIMNWRRESALNGPISLLKIPFVIHPSSEHEIIRWVESSHVSRRVDIVVGIFCALSGIVLVVAALNGAASSTAGPLDKWVFVAAIAGAPLLFASSIFAFASYFAIRSTQRVLEIDLASHVARIVVCDSAKSKIHRQAECDTANLALVRAPAQLQTGPYSFWKGTVLYAKVHGGQIALACLKRASDMNEYERRLPQEIRTKIVSSESTIKKWAIR